MTTRPNAHRGAIDRGAGFFRQYAGADSAWTRRAIEAYDAESETKPRKPGLSATCSVCERIKLTLALRRSLEPELGPRSASSART
jgi:hypothetical protein